MIKIEVSFKTKKLQNFLESIHLIYLANENWYLLKANVIIEKLTREY